jgi:hypothetical protein
MGKVAQGGVEIEITGKHRGSNLLCTILRVLGYNVYIVQVCSNSSRRFYSLLITLLPLLSTSPLFSREDIHATAFQLSSKGLSKSHLFMAAAFVRLRMLMPNNNISTSDGGVFVAAIAMEVGIIRFSCGKREVLA